VLVHGRPADVTEGQHLPGVDHRLGPAADLVLVHAVEQDGHGQGGHLLVGDAAAGVGVEHPVDLLVAQPPAVPLGDDHIDGVMHDRPPSSGS
jgi:hypothetical protein